MGIFNAKHKKSSTEGGKTIIASGCKISGELIDLKGVLHVDGRIDGVIESDFDISIGEDGYISGLIQATNIVVSGVLEGKISCQSIDILSTGKVMGEVISGEMMIESGGRFIGESREMTGGGMIVSFPTEEIQSLTTQALKKNAEKEVLNQELLPEDKLEQVKEG